MCERLIRTAGARHPLGMNHRTPLLRILSAVVLVSAAACGSDAESNGPLPVDPNPQPAGDVLVVDAAATVLVSTGSGDVQLWTTRGPAVVKTGSGDVKVGDAATDVTMTTGSGDLVVSTARNGRMTAKGASGDVRVGIPAGVPVWTDISTISGEIRSTLQGAGQPQNGTDHVEVRAKVVSGDIVLTEI